MNDSIYTQIIKGEIPSHKVYEDDYTMAFLDIRPVQPGMVLVVSKQQVANFYELPDAEYQALWATVKKVACKLHEVFPDKLRIGIQVEGMEVDHAHVKLYPINSAEDFRAEADMAAEPDHPALSAMATKLTIT